MEHYQILRHNIDYLFQGKKEYTPPPWDPFFLGLSPDPEVTEKKNAMVYTIFLGKQGKRVYTIEPQTRKKKKRRVSAVMVYTFFFPVFTYSSYKMGLP